MWENAKAQKDGLQSVGALEIAFYTDLREVRLEGGVGPFAFLTPLSSGGLLRDSLVGAPRMGLVVRVEQYIVPDGYPDYFLDESWEQVDPAVYHGGDAGQELAALLSLALGIRMRSGGIIRVFGPSGEDPRGHPHEHADRVPYLPPPYWHRVLPYTGESSNFDASNVQLLGTYANFSSAEALALVRAARSYQEALWVADSDPRQA